MPEHNFDTMPTPVMVSSTFAKRLRWQRIGPNRWESAFIDSAEKVVEPDWTDEKVSNEITAGNLTLMTGSPQRSEVEKISDDIHDPTTAVVTYRERDGQVRTTVGQWFRTDRYVGLLGTAWHLTPVNIIEVTELVPVRAELPKDLVAATHAHARRLMDENDGVLTLAAIHSILRYANTMGAHR